MSARQYHRRLNRNGGLRHRGREQNGIVRLKHDMRTPLNGVIGYTDMALESNDLETMKDYLKKIKKSGELLMSLINDTLDLSKIETGQISLQKTPADFTELFQKIATSVAPSIQEKKLHFALRIVSEKPLEVSLDVLKMSEIINNLLSNAIKFTPEGGHVSLDLNAQKEKEGCYQTQIVVSDDGIGMSSSTKRAKLMNISRPRSRRPRTNTFLFAITPPNGSSKFGSTMAMVRPTKS